MCSSYQPTVRTALAPYGRPLPAFAYAFDCGPGEVAPFLANERPGEWLPGEFGFVVHAPTPGPDWRAYNAPAETAASAPRYRAPWRHRQLAIIPVQAFFALRYSSNGTQYARWRIARQDGRPFGLAGMWDRHVDGDVSRWSFSLLTVNAEHHPLMSRFCPPGEEKRSVVVLADEEWNAWLSAQYEADLWSFLRLFDPDVMQVQADPWIASTK